MQLTSHATRARMHRGLCHTLIFLFEPALGASFLFEVCTACLYRVGECDCERDMYSSVFLPMPSSFSLFLSRHLFLLSPDTSRL